MQPKRELKHERGKRTKAVCTKVEKKEKEKRRWSGTQAKARAGRRATNATTNKQQAATTTNERTTNWKKKVQASSLFCVLCLVLFCLFPPRSSGRGLWHEWWVSVVLFLRLPSSSSLRSSDAAPRRPCSLPSPLFLQVLARKKKTHAHARARISSTILLVGWLNWFGFPHRDRHPILSYFPSASYDCDCGCAWPWLTMSVTSTSSCSAGSCCCCSASAASARAPPRGEAVGSFTASMADALRSIP